ncbi:eukaryotic translation initiation factor 4 gamma 2a [Thalassophryne amazonica]|uniref:eukaryotic translation initiation factor 4 gamma 2a n=1 Tax=Thalassophryne amazonica TaxID=390379 RepID=UPI00147211C5|nr:eukaryotic translation initiation factor 4 gamma 2a [Thalassophryne amazonica]
MLGNIKFIGELGKLNLIHESILHKCIKTLLEKKNRVQLDETVEDLECLCEIMKTVGSKLDHDKAKSLMDQYFCRMNSLANNKELPSRIRFLLQNIVELRQNGWVAREAFVDSRPKTINQVHQDAAKDLGVFIPRSVDGMKMDFLTDSSFLPVRNKFDREIFGGLADMFGQIPGSEIGTGPGVIQDHYSPTMGHHYSPPMGRHRSSPLFNGDSYQFEVGHKPFMKSSQGQKSPVFNQKQHHSKSRDASPRFIKKGRLSPDEISLRPAQTFNMNKNQVPKQQPQMTRMSTQSTQAPQLGQFGLKANIVPIQEKPSRSNKKAPPTKEDLLKMTENIVADFLKENNVDEAVRGVKQMKTPKHLLSEILVKIVACTLDCPAEDKKHAGTLIHALCREGLFTGEDLIQAILSILEHGPNAEEEISPVKSYLAQVAAQAVSEEVVSIADLAHPLENGAHFPLFLISLQEVVKLKDCDWLSKEFQQSKVNMQKMLPEMSQNKDKMLEILESQDLSFLFPLMKVEKQLLKQIKVDPSPQSICKWIRDNISPKLHTDKGFINLLMTSLLQYITEEISVHEEQLATPTKEQLEEEKQLLLAVKPVLQTFLHNRTNLQFSALYALQVHCNTKGFPKGMLLRYFMHLYDMEIIEEEAFLLWKEDITQEFPGKGKALFQVNQWLTWLETAEEESEDEDY